jgi:hypothetical protein
MLEAPGHWRSTPLLGVSTQLKVHAINRHDGDALEGVLSIFGKRRVLTSHNGSCGELMSLDARRSAQHPLRSEVHWQVKDFGEIAVDLLSRPPGRSACGLECGNRRTICSSFLTGRTTFNMPRHLNAMANRVPARPSFLIRWSATSRTDAMASCPSRCQLLSPGMNAHASFQAVRTARSPSRYSPRTKCISTYGRHSSGRPMIH